MPSGASLAILGGAAISAGAGVYNANRSASAQRDLYNAQYAAESSAAIANAEAAVRAANAEAEAIIAGGHATAGATVKGAEAHAQSIRIGASEQAKAAQAAADAAYGEAYRNVGLMKQEADESLRKLESEQTQYEEKARAKAAASGGEYTGTTRAYVEGMIGENDKQYGWLKNAYASQQKVAIDNAAAERSASYRYAEALYTAGEAEANATITAGKALAHSYNLAAGAQAHATRVVGRAHQGAAYKAYGGPTSGQWYNTAFANAQAARNRGASFQSVIGASRGYEYAAAKAYGRV